MPMTARTPAATMAISWAQRKVLVIITECQEVGGLRLILHYKEEKRMYWMG